MNCVSPPPSASSLPPPCFQLPRTRAEQVVRSAGLQHRGAAGLSGRLSAALELAHEARALVPAPSWAEFSRGSAPWCTAANREPTKTLSAACGPGTVSSCGVTLSVNPLSSRCSSSLVAVQKAKLPFTFPRTDCTESHFSGTFRRLCCSLLRLCSVRWGRAVETGNSRGTLGPGGRAQEEGRGWRRRQA